jgi:hypothetical protein
MCIGDSVILTASSGFIEDSYQWNTGETGKVLVVTEAGKYSVSAIILNSNCISKSDTIVVTTYERPETPIITFIPEADPDVYPKYDTLEAPVATKYQWYKNGDAISNGKSRRLVVLREALTKYTVTISNEGDCYSDTSEPFVSIIDDYAEAITITPNPAHNNIEVKLTENYYGEYFISIVDVTGKLVKEYNYVYFDGEVEVFNINSLPAGTYMLKLTSDKHTITKTFIKTDK